jgi:hypothetical protein
MIGRAINLISYIIISIMVIVLLLFAGTWCHGEYRYYKNYSYKPIKRKAQYIISTIDSNKINKFTEWNYFRRGSYCFSKHIPHTTECRLWYSRSDDTLIIRLHRGNMIGFNEVFDTRINIDSSLAEISLSLYGNNVKVEEQYFLRKSDTLYTDSLVVNNIAIGEIFPTKNPFDFFNPLVAFIDSINARAIYNDDNSIKFYLSDVYVLLYIPDKQYGEINANIKKKYDYETVEKIVDKWYLIKCKVPFDNG